MQPVQFIAAAFVAYLGLPGGLYLASLTKEELPTGKKYFPLLQRLSILGIAAITMDYFHLAAAGKVAIYVVLLGALLFRLLLPLLYVIFGGLLAAVANDKNTALMVASGVFLFGLLTGGMEFKSSRRKKGLVRQISQLARQWQKML